MLFYQHEVYSNPPLGSTSAPVSVTAAANGLILGSHKPFRVVRWAFLATTTVNDATNALKLTCDFRPTAGSDAGRITGASTVNAAQTGWNAPSLPAVLYDLAGGSMTLVAGTSQIAAGQIIYHEVAAQKPSATYTPYYPDPDTANDSPGGVNAQFVVYPGQELVLAVQSVAPAAGAGKFLVEVEALAFTGSKNNYPQLASGIPSAIRPTPSDPGTLTRVLS